MTAVRDTARYPTDLAPEAWAYASGLCAARETVLLQGRFIDELGTLTPAEVASRITRTFFGPAEPLSEFDRIAAERVRGEIAEVSAACPSELPADLAGAREAADAIRQGVNELPERLDAKGFAHALERISLRAGPLADLFAAAFELSWPSPDESARSAAALAIDAAELCILHSLASHSGDPVVIRWAELRVGEGSARVAERSIALGVSRELLGRYFFRGVLLSQKARDLLIDFTPAAAQALYPDGLTPENAEARILEAVSEARGEPFSAARVLYYLLAFQDQIARLRLATCLATGGLRREAA